MFERFTEKAINVVTESQNYAKLYGYSEVTPELLFLTMVSEAKGVSLKLLRYAGLNKEFVQNFIDKKDFSKEQNIDNIPFSKDVKELLKKTLDLASKSGNNNILFEHIFLVLISSDNSIIQNIIKQSGFDVSNAKNMLNKLVERKIKRLEHPEGIAKEEIVSIDEPFYEGDEISKIFDRAVSKLSTAGYEILGTEQIVSSILESNDSTLVEILKNHGIDFAKFEEKLAQIKSRNSEFEDKKIIFTPNAFLVMNQALETAKELGSSVVKPEHVILSLLQTKKGLAYEIIKSFDLDENFLKEEILKPIEKQMSETISIMKLAKEEARRIGKNVVGTEMFLLGILAEGTSLAAKVLTELEVTIKDARLMVENLVGYGNEYFDEEIAFTTRAKKVLEHAWVSAKKQHKQKIEAVDLLLAITEEPESIAMKVLNSLGVDSVEIRHGIQGLNK